MRTGSLDVLAQHVMGCACGEPFRSDDLYEEVRRAAPYAALLRSDFDDVVKLVQEPHRPRTQRITVVDV